MDKNKQNKSTIYKKARASKYFVTLFYCFLGVLLFSGYVVATTVITNTVVDSPRGTYTNLSADTINSILYVEAGNGSDISVKIDLCPTSGCKIILPSGNYTLTGAINFQNKNNIQIIGNGANTKILLNSSSTSIGHVFRLDNSSNMEMGNMWIENIGSGDNSGGIRVDSTGSSDNLYFHDLTIKNFNKGDTDDGAMAGIKIGEQTNPSRAITNVVIERVVSDNNYRGFYINVGSYGVTLRDVYASNNNKAGIESDSSTTINKPSESLKIYNCWMENNVEHGILLEGTSEAIVDGCDIINSTNYGITVYGPTAFSEASKIRIVDNYLENNGLAQIHVRTWTYNTSRIIIDNNIIYRNISTTSTSAQGILIRPENSTSSRPENIIISNNIIDILDGTTHNSAGLGVQIQGSIYPNNIIVDSNYFYPSPASSVGASVTNKTIMNNINLANNLLGDMAIQGNLTITQKITFALAETIDNLIDGWLKITGSLEVTGDLNVTGTVTSANITADNINGEIHVSTGVWSDIQGAVDNCSIVSGGDITTRCKVIVSGGAYTPDITLDLKSGVTLEFSRDAKVINPSVEDMDIIMPQPYSEVKNIIFDSVNSNFSGNIIYMNGSYKFTSVRPFTLDGLHAYGTTRDSSNNTYGTVIYFDSNSTKYGDESSVTYSNFGNIVAVGFEYFIYNNQQTTPGQTAYTNSNNFYNIIARDSSYFWYDNSIGTGIQTVFNSLNNIQIQVAPSSKNSIIKLDGSYNTFQVHISDINWGTNATLMNITGEYNDMNLIGSYGPDNVYLGNFTNTTTLRNSWEGFFVGRDTDYQGNDIENLYDVKGGFSTGGNSILDTLRFQNESINILTRNLVGDNFNNRIIIDSGIDRGKINMLGQSIFSNSEQSSSRSSNVFVFPPSGEIGLKVAQDNNNVAMAIETKATTSNVVTLYADDGSVRTSGYLLSITDDAATSSAVTMNIRSDGSGSPLRLQLNSTAKTCDSTNEGGIYYDGTTKKHYGCNSTDWNALY